MSMNIEILEILNNTFIGTLLAGILIALFGIFLYRQQKKIDLQYEEYRKIKELSALLFSNIEIASKDFNGQIAIYNGKNRELEIIGRNVNLKTNNQFRNEMQLKFLRYSNEMEIHLNNLISVLKLHKKDNYNKAIKILAEKVPVISFYLMANFTLAELDKKEIENIEISFDNEVALISKTLQNLIEKFPKSTN